LQPEAQSRDQADEEGTATEALLKASVLHVIEIIISEKSRSFKHCAKKHALTICRLYL
jgi:hypothetical protein